MDATLTARTGGDGRAPYAARDGAHPARSARARGPRARLVVIVLAVVAGACQQAGSPDTGTGPAEPEVGGTPAAGADAPAPGEQPAADAATEREAAGTRARERSPAAREEAVVSRPRTDPSDFQAGMAVLVYGNEEPEHFRDKTRRALDRLAGLHANSVSVVFPVYQEHWRATEVFAHEERTPSPDRLRWFVRAARERGFTVMLRPVLDEQSLVTDGQWRGSIRPADLDAWFDSYGELLAGYATLAAEEDAAILAVGSELTSLQDETDRWLALVERVRAVYDGQLLYAANWDAPLPEFSGALDWYGVDAFFPLEVAGDASVEELSAAWDPWLARFEEAGVDLDRVVFTEIGVRAQEGAHRRPFVWEHGTRADPDAQRRYYEAACERLGPALAGLYWWKVDFDFPDAADSVESFSPLGKPAEDALRRCYGDRLH